MFVRDMLMFVRHIHVPDGGSPGMLPAFQVRAG